MSVIAGPNLVKENLKFLIDASNSKNLLYPENLFTFSEDFSNASWIKDLEVTFSSTLETTAPDGTYSATKMVLNPRYKGAIPIYRTFNVSPLLRYTESVYLKYAGMRYAFFWWDTGSGNGCTVEVDLINGTIRNTRIGDSIYYTSFNTGIESVGNGWYRVYISGIPTAIQSNVSPRIYCSNTATGAIFNFGNPIDYNENGRDGIYFWGWQAEQSSTPTTYTKTTSSTITRQVIDFSESKINGTFASGAGVLYPDGLMFFDGSNDIINFNISSLNFSTAQTIFIGLMPNENDANRRNPYNHEYAGYGTITHEPSGVFNYYHGISGGNGAIYQGATSTFTVTQNEKSIITVSRGSSNVKWYKNGILSDTAGNSYPTAFNSVPTLQIGFGYAGAYSGNIYFVALYDRQLTDSEILQNFNAFRTRYAI